MVKVEYLDKDDEVLAVETFKGPVLTLEDLEIVNHNCYTIPGCVGLIQ